MGCSHKLELFEQKEICRVNENGNRLYVGEDGSKYPSVTSALSVLGKNGIQRWKDAVGHEEADKIGSRAARFGTALHEVAEKYIRYDPSWHNCDLITRYKFERIRKYIDENIDIVYGIELQMVSNVYKIGGTVDLICNYNNIPSILDFKTSNRQKTKDEIVSYFIQCCAYAQMAEELYGFKAEQAVILMSVEDGFSVAFTENINKYKRLTKNFFKHYHAGNI